MKPFRCFLAKDPNVLGYVIDRIKTDVQDPKVDDKGNLESISTKIVVNFGVAWDETPVPAISYHSPADIGFLYCPEIDLAEAKLQEFEEEDEDESTEEGEELEPEPA